MQKHRQPSRLVAAICFLGVLSVFSIVSAQNTTFDELNQQSPMTEPRVLITVHLTLPNNRAIMVSQFDGEMITTGRADNILGIIPHVLDNGSVSLDFYHVTRITELNMAITEELIGLGSIEMDGTRSRSAPVDTISKIQVMSVTKARKFKPFRAGCCVTCDGETTCGVCVEVWCGTCGC